ncbi:MAG TPA: amino acid adenylation domain-containing protein, partial [Candidatus Angelobacter sp.]|nr:amino acid adenylation domain-containing protein [Candidatus Angelobacter sp.]
RSNQLARFLQKRGVGDQTLVGLMVERSPEMLVALLGILKAGGAYLPLDPAQPKERIGFILQDAGVAILLTENGVASALPETGAQRIELGEIASEVAAESSVDLAAATRPEARAYVLYTSGSTGKPKGVEIEHRQLVNFLTSMREKPGLNEEDVLVAVTTLSFDIAGLELYLPLLCGAKVVLATREEAADGQLLCQLLEGSQATVMQATPATWRMLLDVGWKGDPRLKILCGGEALAPDLANQLLPLSGELWNMYGPTETTIWSSVYRVDHELQQVASIGRPIANTTMYVLDAQRQPVPIGVAGELYIGGEGVARGYLKRAELTAERFVADPFCPGERLYRTGDRAFYLPDGNLQFLGRADFQVKIRGFRIELGEIESELAKHPAVERAVVTVREDRPGDKRLVGYVVPRVGQDPTTAELKAHLELTLPDYMVPRIYQKLEVLPLTPNGKINRLGLPAPDLSRAEDANGSAPNDPFEMVLAGIWERVLGVSNIGVHENFFDLGGHSLMAVRLLAEVEKVVGRKIPLASLFRGSTVAGLATLIRENKESDPEPLVVSLQVGSGTASLFAVAAPGVKTLGYAQLCRHVGTEQSVYKLQAEGPVASQRPYTLQELQSLGRQYATAIRAVQPEGPYFIIAMCEGAHIAEQMTLQLESAGQEVAMFAILDAWVLQNVRRPMQSRLVSYQQRLLAMRKLSLGEQLRTLKNGLRTNVRILTGRATRSMVWDEVYWPENFSLTRFNAPVVLFKRPKQPSCYIDDPEMGWGARSESGVEIHEIDAEHTQMLREPNVRVIGQALARRLRAGNCEHESSSGLQAAEKALPVSSDPTLQSQN